ncbi:hypothetical protein jhhlp_007492 [Lomentospora prolificans]|uniref:Uncharacterized protein n=1 Tax=Lomentospora prolificans TaxID=41688 RepID=A0A2N3N173_9PEZI|nr:hypothetical protein jhhlp_007492 [Lomentospora prolificans]
MPFQILTSLILLAAASPIIGAAGSHHQTIQPSAARARENAADIFNAVHAAMRQWGSSLHHNGLGLIPATVPEGTMLYHGSMRNSTPDSFEWLAFEIEHAENFAWSRPDRGAGGPGKRPGPPGGPPGGPGERPGSPPPGEGPDRQDSSGRQGPHQQMRAWHHTPDFSAQVPLGETTDDHEGVPNRRGYLHMYRANRNLNLLYIDGMSAGKSNKGTLDSQDLLLRGITGSPSFGERERAADICKLVKEWGLDGVIRMEAGFEILYCDFEQGLDLVEMLRRPRADSPELGVRMGSFEWLRATAARYEGIGGGRAKLDFSGMVNVLWYPVNTTNPNGELPRLVETNADERQQILARVAEVARTRIARDGIDWQGVVDMIVSRHDRRIAHLAEDDVEEIDFAGQVFALTNTFVDSPSSPSDIIDMANLDDGAAEARRRCAEHYLRFPRESRATWTKEDEMIDAAIQGVTARICDDFFTVRSLLLQRNTRQPQVSRVDALERARGIMRSLKRDLDWAAWKKCAGCKVNEICFVAMWPFGLVQDHYTPSCMNSTRLAERHGFGRRGEGYWSD